MSSLFLVARNSSHKELTISLFQRFCSSVGLFLVTLTALIIVANQYEPLKTLDPYYRITMPALCLAFSFFLSTINIRLGIIGCLFALPLLPNLTLLILQYFGYGRILSLHNAGFDLSAGFLLGSLVNQFLHRKNEKYSFSFPWQAGLFIIFISVSVALAITRNLHQTASIFQPSALLYNLLHFRSIDWHDDYRPLFDWLAYGCATAIIFIVSNVLKFQKNRNDFIFLPLILSLIIAAIVAYRQSQYGVGLTPIQINFRLDQFGHMAFGFQHDIHAFAGQMLIGAIGLWGYLYYARNNYIRSLILVFVPLSWVALFLSKSKSNFALAVVCLGFILFIWLLRHSRFLIPAIKVSLYLVLITVISALLFQSIWIEGLTRFAHLIGLPSFDALNLKLSYRPEVYLAGIKLFSLFPLLGLGQGEFYRQAADYALTNSFFLSIDQNGENAHNYFLQTLAETGLVGGAVFSLLIFYPFFHIREKRVLIPAAVALSAIFIGNIFGHSMLVRENLFIAASLIGLMYAWMSASPISSPNNDGTMVMNGFIAFIKKPFFVMTISCVLALLVIREVYLSFRLAPFNQDIQCFKARPLDPDGWSSGLFISSIPEKAKGMILNIKGVQPYVAKRTLTATLSIIHNGKSISDKPIYFNHEGAHKVAINFPNDRIADDGEYQIALRLQRCFIPRNLKINEDGRRLGIQIDSVTPAF